MKYFFPLALLATASHPTLEDVYGPVPRVEAMGPIWRSAVPRAGRPVSFYNARTPEICDFPLEILIVQDLTASFNDNFEALVNDQLPLMFSDLGEAHPNTTYAVATFRDKPIVPFGTPATDYCAKIGLDFTSDSAAVSEYYRPLTRVGGGDPPENQFGALLAGTQSTKLSWGNVEASTKLVVMVTDAPPHFENDGHDTLGMTPATGLYNDDTAEEDCLKEYYPNPDQVLSSLKAVEAYFAVLVYDPEYWNGLPARSWQWFNRFIGQTDEFANLSANDLSDFWVQLSKVIQFIENLECVPTSTNPPVTTVATTAPVTPAPTTTPAAPTATPVGGTEAAPTTAGPAPTTPGPTTTAPVGVTEAAPTTAATVAPTATPVGGTELPPGTDECEETTICDEDVLIRIGFQPDRLNVVVNGRQIAKV